MAPYGNSIAYKHTSQVCDPLGLGGRELSLHHMEQKSQNYNMDVKSPASVAETAA